MLPTWDDLEEVQATIWDTMTEEKLSSCQICAAAYWPQWCKPSLVSSLCDDSSDNSVSKARLSSMRGFQQCFIHSLAGLLTMQRGRVQFKTCGGKWLHMSSDDPLVTTLLAGIHVHHPCYRVPHAFQHYHTASAHERSMLIPAAHAVADASRDKRKSHPFLCAWLPGTTIYAAAAFGHVYVVDGKHDALLKMWRVDAQEEPPFAEFQLPTKEPEFAGISWSSDGRCLAWLAADELCLHVISFD